MTLYFLHLFFGPYKRRNKVFPSHVLDLVVAFNISRYRETMRVNTSCGSWNSTRLISLLGITRWIRSADMNMNTFYSENRWVKLRTTYFCRIFNFYSFMWPLFSTCNHCEIDRDSAVVFGQWFMGLRNGMCVYAMVRGFTQWFVGFRKGLWVYEMVCGFAYGSWTWVQWFILNNHPPLILNNLHLLMVNSPSALSYSSSSFSLLLILLVLLLTYPSLLSIFLILAPHSFCLPVRRGKIFKPSQIVGGVHRTPGWQWRHQHLNFRGTMEARYLSG